jgi:hypothetical protein
MSRDAVARALAAAGVGVGVEDLAEPVVGWLAAAPAAEVQEGIARAADAPAAGYGLDRLLASVAPPPRPGRVASLLRLLGGSGLAGALRRGPRGGHT